MPRRQFQHVPRTFRAHTQSSNGMFQIIARTGGRCQMIHTVYGANLEGVGDVFLQKLEARVRTKVSHVLEASRDQVVNPDYLMAIV